MFKFCSVIIDLGAADHMASFFNLFSSNSPCSGSEKSELPMVVSHLLQGKDL